MNSLFSVTPVFAHSSSNLFLFSSGLTYMIEEVELDIGIGISILISVFLNYRKTKLNDIIRL